MGTTNVNTRLRELHGSGYEIVDGQPDIEGWTITDANGQKIGVVDDMLFDAELQKVRYIIAHLKGNDFHLEKRRVLIPIGMAELHENNDYVVVPSVSAWQIRALPTYRRDELKEDDEQDIFTIFSSASPGAVTGSTMTQRKVSDLYEHANFNHDNLYRNRRKSQIVDQPADRSFRIRQDWNQSSRSQNEQESDPGRTLEARSPQIAVVDTDQRNIADNDVSTSRDRPGGDIARRSQEENIMDRIRRMESELEVLKSSLRSTNR